MPLYSDNGLTFSPQTKVWYNLHCFNTWRIERWLISLTTRNALTQDYAKIVDYKGVTMAPQFIVDHVHLKYKKTPMREKKLNAKNGQRLAILSATGAERTLKMQSLNCVKNVVNIIGLTPIKPGLHEWKGNPKLDHALRVLHRLWENLGTARNISLKIFYASTVYPLMNMLCSGKNWNNKNFFVTTQGLKSFLELMPASIIDYRAAVAGKTILPTAFGVTGTLMLSKGMQLMKNLLTYVNVLQENLCEIVKCLRRTQQPSVALLSLPALKGEVSRSKI